jgi:hypothetical protein
MPIALLAGFEITLKIYLWISKLLDKACFSYTHIIVSCRLHLAEGNEQRVSPSDGDQDHRVSNV